MRNIHEKGYIKIHLKVTHGSGWTGRTKFEEANCDVCDKTFSSKQEGSQSPFR